MPIRLNMKGVSDKGMEPVEAGTYAATIFSIEKKSAKEKKTPYLELTFKLKDTPEKPELKNRKLFLNVSLQQQSLWRLKQILVRTGAYTSEEMAEEFDFDPARLKGKEVTLKVKIRMWEGEPRNDVKDVFGPDGDITAEKSEKSDDSDDSGDGQKW